MASADFGQPPENAEALIKAWLDDFLNDPMSAKMEILAPPEKSWWGVKGALLQPRDIHYCWVVRTRVMAKNKFGAYIGWRPYDFYIRDGAIEYYQTVR
jgi:hypothetical protein